MYPTLYKVKHHSFQPISPEGPSVSGDSPTPDVDTANESTFDLGRDLPSMILQPTSLGSEMHDLPSIPSPPEHRNPSAGVISPIHTQNGFLINDEASDLDWIFQDVRGEYLDTLSLPADCMLPDPIDFGLASLNPQRPCQNAQEPAASYQLTGSPQESWLLDRSIPASQLLELPELGSPNVKLRAGSYVQLERITDCDRAKIQRSVMHFLERPIWKPLSLATFPSKEKLDHCIDLFFANFHPVRGPQTLGSNSFLNDKRSTETRLIITPGH